MLYEHSFLTLPVYDIGVMLLLVAAGLTMWSMADYIRAAWPLLTGRESPNPPSQSPLGHRDPEPE